MAEAESQDLRGLHPIVDLAQIDREDDLKWPNRPKNQHDTLPFRTLYQDLFDPLIANRKPLPGQKPRRKVGPNAVNSQNPHAIRRAIIEQYISRWRKEVGNDFYPALRLILPDKDRDRAMYGLKEKVLARYIIRILKIDKNSDDGYNLLNFKQPGQGSAQRVGDFPGRVHEVLVKRPFRTKPGNMSISEVNYLLNQLSARSKEEEQLPIIEEFYRNMNPDEFKWLVSIMLRNINVGATEKTFLNIWHPDAEIMFNISSSLKRVCWELWNENIRLEKEENRGISLGECFQPQLAQFQVKKMNSIVARMQTTEEDPEFWIEEKLDGERMQLHMETKVDDNSRSYKSFSFWSRKAKNYTYLYGSSFDDKQSALTRHLKDAFDDGVESLILDGEMITWDTETDKMVPFGSLKTAALEHSRNAFSTAPRPLYRVFDVLYLNGKDLTRYDLRTRRLSVLERVIKPVDRRLEILEYTIGKTWDDIEHALRKVVEEASEGLVVKNPRSRYRLNDRNDDWVKVKPEYMEEFGESLDCLVIGGYYGSGKRGGGLSSFLCGLRLDNDDEQGPSRKFSSFFKVGGGMTANDYANIRHHTEGKWVKWDRQNPPQDYQIPSEIPDVWIRPDDSVVIQAKAASVGPSDEFGVNLTLRFPRFQKLRGDKDWTTALSLQEFYNVREAAETKREEHKQEAQAKMQAQNRKRHQRVDLRRRPLQVAGYTQRSISEATASLNVTGVSTNVFKGLTMYVLTDADTPKKATKLQLEEMIKAHGGRIIQTASQQQEMNSKSVNEVICIGCRRNVKVAGLLKMGTVAILKPTWLFDCIAQARVDLEAGVSALPLRPEVVRHVYFAPADRAEIYEMETDAYGDSYARDVSIAELRNRMSSMPKVEGSCEPDERLMNTLGESPGSLFKHTTIYFVETKDTVQDGTSDVQPVDRARNCAHFAGARVAMDLEDSTVTHVVVDESVTADRQRMKDIRARISRKDRLPRVVTLAWIEESWNEKTRLDEERYAPI